jgi:hypothetical protein
MTRKETRLKREKVQRLREKIDKALAQKPSTRRWSLLRRMQDDLRHMNVNLELSLFSSAGIKHPDTAERY